MRRSLIWTLVAAVSASTTVAVYLLLFFSPGPGAVAPIDIELLRRKAVQEPGELPLRFNGVLIGESTAGAGFTVAGASLLRQVGIGIVSYQLVYADQAIIIETGHNAKMHAEKFGDGFRPAAYEQMQKAMRGARVILVTHEHTDHLGGLATSPYLDELLPKTLLTREQLENPHILRSGLPSDAITRFEPLRYEGAYSPAPGLVLLKAPGHSPGSQMVYVRLASGREFLLAGDIAWNHAAVTETTGKPLLINMVMLNEDRNQVAGQLKQLRDLERDAGVTVIAAHDLDQWRRLTERGWIGSEFEMPGQAGGQ